MARVLARDNLLVQKERSKTPYLIRGGQKGGESSMGFWKVVVMTSLVISAYRRCEGVRVI